MSNIKCTFSNERIEYTVVDKGDHITIHKRPDPRIGLLFGKPKDDKEYVLSMSLGAAKELIAILKFMLQL